MIDISFSPGGLAGARSGTPPPPLPTVRLSAAQSRNEGDSGTVAFTYTVTRTATVGAAAVAWSFSPGTTSANDFAGGAYPTGGTVNLADGVATGTFTVSVAGDATVEPDESFTVSIAAPVGYALGSPSSATGTILNDDSAPTPTVAISAAQSQAEGNSGTRTWTYTVTRSVTAGAIVVPWSFSAGGTNAADWQGGVLPTGSNVAIADGAATGTLTVTSVGDSVVEGDEAFSISIAAPSGYALGSPSSATGTILNDDVPLPTIARVVAAGDSITVAGGYLNAFTAAYPGVTLVNRSSGGRGVGTSANKSDDGNSLWGQFAVIVADAPDLLTILIGANDLRGAASAAAWQADLFGFIADVRAALPNVVVMVSTVLPVSSILVGDNTHNTRRAVVNPALRAAVGSQIHGVIPMGDHPVASTDAAWEAYPTAYTADGLHPTPAAHALYAQQYRAAVGSVVDKATATSPAFTFTDVNNVPLSQVTYAETLVTGMKLGNAASVSRSGAGDFKLAQGSYGTGPTAGAMNGDIVTSRVTASASPDTPVDHTLTIGATSDIFTVRTAASGPIALNTLAVWSNAPGDFSTSRTYPAVPFPAGRQLACFASNSGGVFDSVSIDGQACVLVASTLAYQMWLAPFVAATAGNRSVAVTRSANAINNVDIYAMGLTEMGTGGTVSGSAFLAPVYRADGAHAASGNVPIASGGLGVVFYLNEGTGAQATRFNLPAGWTLARDHGNNLYALTFGASQTPTITSLQYGTTMMIAGGFAK